MTQLNNDQQPYVPSYALKERELNLSRANLLTQLRDLGTQTIEMEYDGYDDSGSVEFVDIMPSHIFLSENTDECLRKFGFDFVLACHPGFEIDCGASGTVHWNLSNDTIEIQHQDNGEDRDVEICGGL